MKLKTVLAWSSGKDSALVLYKIQREKNIEIINLLTTITQSYDRITMHGVHRTLVEQQAKNIGLPLETVILPKNVSDEDYERIIQNTMMKYKKNGVSNVAFGDIFLQDVRKYREKNLSKIKMEAIFPLWDENTQKLAYSFIDLGFKAIVTCVDSKHLDKSFTGRIFNEKFLSDLPENVDPCGENGEFHTFVYDGPIFMEKISIKKGEIILRDNRFYYCDLLIE